METGTAIVIMRPKRVPPEHYPAVLVAERDTVVGLTLQGLELVPGEDVLLVHGTLGNRHMVDALYVSARDGVGIFKIKGLWRRLDPRASPRFELHTPVEVRSVLGTSRQEGQMFDVSLGGMAVHVAERPGGTEVEVIVAYGGYSGRLRCVIAGCDPDGDNHVLLRLKFTDMTPAQEAFVRQVVARAAEHDAFARIAS